MYATRFDYHRPRSLAEAADLLLDIGVIKQKPDMDALADTRFIQ